MKRLIIWFLVALAAPLALSTKMSMAAERPSRPCTPADLAGIWEMKSMTGEMKGMKPSDPFLAAYQRYRFTADGKMMHVVSVTPIAGNKALESRIKNSLLTSTYTLDPTGILTIYKIESAQPERCLCANVLEEPAAEKLAGLLPEKRTMIPLKGDVMLTYLDGQGKPVLGKILKKLS